MIEIQVRGSGDRAVKSAWDIFDKICITTGLKKDVNRHNSAKKPSQRKREKHLKALMKQKDIDKKLLNKQRY